jgi:hypothetical protein
MLILAVPAASLPQYLPEYSKADACIDHRVEAFLRLEFLGRVRGTFNLRSMVWEQLLSIPTTQGHL